MRDPPEWEGPIGDINKRGIGSCWTPIFCTAVIDPEIVDDFLKCDDARKPEDDDDAYSGYFLVTTAFTPPATMQERKVLFFNKGMRQTISPVKPFESPCIGKSVAEVAEIWRQYYTGGPFTEATFLVFDERTKRDRKSCLVWSNTREGGTARCEFGIVYDVLCNPESGNSALNEAIHPTEFVDPENPHSGEHYYTVEEYERIFPTYTD